MTLLVQEALWPDAAFMEPTVRRHTRGPQAAAQAAADRRDDSSSETAPLRENVSIAEMLLAPAPPTAYRIDTSTAPVAISPTPSQFGSDSSSPRNTTPKIATSTTLSLSIGATRAASPSFSARK